MLISFIRWIKGYVKIQLIGYSPERFINLCKNKNIIVWGLKSSRNSYEMYMLIKDFRKIKPLCKKTITRVKILEREGFPFVLNHFRKRKPFLSGFFVAIILIYFLSLRLWMIDIEGNLGLTNDVICTYFREQNITVGIPKNNIDCAKIAADMRKQFDNIVWVSASLDGTRLQIKIKENTDSKGIQMEELQPSDIIAKFDGTITSMITRAGVPMVQVGDEVKEGDLLVSGSIPVLNDAGEVTHINYTHADADIMAKTELLYKNELSNLYYQKTYMKEGWFWKTMEDKTNRELFVDFRFINLGKYKEYSLTETTYTEERVEQMLKEEFQRYCKELETENTIILDRKLTIIHYKNNSLATSNMKLLQPIEEERKIIDLYSENMVQ